MERLLRRAWFFIDSKAAWAFADEKSRRLLLRAVVVQLLCVAVLWGRAQLPGGLWWRLLPDLLLAVLAALHLIQYPFIVLFAALGCFEVRGRKQRLPLEPWVLRARLTVLVMLTANIPLWWLLVKVLWRAGVYNALLADD